MGRVGDIMDVSIGEEFVTLWMLMLEEFVTYRHVCVGEEL